MNLLSSIANFLEAALSVKQPSVHMLTFKLVMVMVIVMIYSLATCMASR